MNTLSVALDPVISAHLEDPQDGLESLAFSALLEKKGRVLDFFSSSGFNVSESYADTEAKGIFENILRTREQLSKLFFSSSSDISSSQSIEEISQLQAQLSELESQASRKISDIGQNLTTVTPEAIVEKIPEDSVLVEFLVYKSVAKGSQFNEMISEERYAVYTVKADGTIQGTDLGRVVEVDALIEDVQRAVRNPKFKEEEVKEAARALDARVMAPIRERIGSTKHLLLSPDGALNLIPFEALVDEEGDYLVKNYTLTYLTSGRDLLRMQSGAAAQSEPILIANPNFERPGNLGASTRYVGLQERKWTVLEGSGQEADEIAANLSSAQNLQGADATEAALKQANRPQFLHIATHGFFESVSPNEDVSITDNPLLRSGIVLSGVNVGQSGAEEDGIVSALEVSSLNLVGTQLAVLSACETGLGDLSLGEGVYGLRRALVLAGSESQLISLWRVQDDTTRDLMVKYYKNLLSGTGRSEALRQTQLAMLENEATAHPYYWAAFINSGNWQPISD